MNPLIYVGAWIATTAIGYACFKGSSQTGQIKIMNVRKKLNNIKKIDDATKNSLL